jgi:D-aminoacyl-tRNA deacylase
LRALIQRVSEAAVSVEGRLLGRIGPGLLVLLGVGQGDGEPEAARLAAKVANLRVFDDEQGRMNRSLLDAGGAALCVSQFTLYADTRRGLRPSFTGAAEPEVADRLYEEFCMRLTDQGVPVETGAFGARMAVSLTNDGPVTLLVET